MGKQIAFGPFVVDPKAGALYRQGESVPIGYRALRLLVALASRPGEILSKSSLIDTVWEGAAIEEGNLSVQITALRKLLGENSSGDEWIATIPRVGYRFLGRPANGPVELDRKPETSAVNTSGDRPSIAVLPFVNLSDDPTQDYFGDGITEDIITALSKLRGFLVIASSSTFAYKGKIPDIRQVARELGVRYVLEGSVRKAGERLRVTAQLVDATSANHLWAERYDRPAIEIFALQDEITASVVAAIEPQLYAAEGLRLLSKPPESLDAWGCVVRAMPYIWMWVIQDDDTGLKLLNRAIELDPGYARARSLLAWVFATRVTLGNLDYEKGISDGLALAQRAIDLDPEDPWAHFAAGYVYVFSRRFGPAVEELNEALQRNPNFAFVRVILGCTYGYGGLADEGLRQLEIATRLSPRDHIQAANLSVEGLCHFVARRYSEAVTAERRAVQMRPNFGPAWRTLAASAGLAGDLPLARQGLAECRRLQPNISLDWVEKYHPIVRHEDRTRYKEGLRQAGLE